jgi:hypothetical protein
MAKLPSWPRKSAKHFKPAAHAVHAQQHPGHPLLRGQQGHRQQCLPGRGLAGQEAGVEQAGGKVADVHHAVLAQGELQQLLAVVVGRQAGAVTRQQPPVEPGGFEPEPGVGRVEQVDLHQRAAAERRPRRHQCLQQALPSVARASSVKVPSSASA